MSQPIEHLVINHVRMIDPASGLDRTGDLCVSGGKVVANCGQSSPPKVIDGSGLIACPSFVDLRANFFDPGLDYREGLPSGLLAAAAGGFGTVCCLPATEPVLDSATALQAVLNRGASLPGAKLLPLGALTKGLKGLQLAELGDMQEAGAVAVTDGDASRASSAVLRRAFEYASGFNLLVIQQPADPLLAPGSLAHEGAISTRLGLSGCPAATEEIALSRDLALVRLTGVRYHASALSTLAGVELIRRAKAEGLPVTADVAAHQLVLTDEALANFDSRCHFRPPLRSEEHRQALLAGLIDGSIDAIVSDHTPLSAIETDCEFQETLPGATSLEFCLPLINRLVQDGELPLATALLALSSGPRRVLHLEAPRLEPGQIADFTLYDPSKKWIPSQTRLKTRSKNSPFFESELVGRVCLTAADGSLIYEE